jgi:hypothetical protein
VLQAAVLEKLFLRKRTHISEGKFITNPRGYLEYALAEPILFPSPRYFVACSSLMGLVSTLLYGDF